ncbi:unnamed protein product [Adineta steineri]|uniref:Uncharacterized protein n=2 Tax=Adineta steineri TaxID=433720 RepID=A0A819HGC4_9BILA|nr:unnamed protein product [Adineta steineri]
MEESVQLENDGVSLADVLVPLIRDQLDLDDSVEVDNEQEQQLPPLSKQQLPTKTVRSLLKTETDPDAIESLELVLNSVVKVFCTKIPCSFYLPWNPKSRSKSENF